MIPIVIHELRERNAPSDTLNEQLHLSTVGGTSWDMNQEECKDQRIVANQPAQVPGGCRCPGSSLDSIDILWKEAGIVGPLLPVFPLERTPRMDSVLSEPS